MEDSKMIDILKRIKMFLKDDSLELARELTNAELENLEGISEQRCMNTKYYFYDFYCKYCENLNCSSNQNK